MLESAAIELPLVDEALELCTITTEKLTSVFIFIFNDSMKFFPAIRNRLKIEEIISHCKYCHWKERTIWVAGNIKSLQ